MSRWLTVECWMAALLLVLVTMILGCGKGPDKTVVALKEVSAFDVPDAVHGIFCFGQGVQCTEQQDPNVTAYPVFVSARPLFGRIHLPRQFHQELTGRWYSIALDEFNGTGQGYDRLYFDLNTNLDLTDDSAVEINDNAAKKAFFPDSRIAHQVCFNCLNIDLPFEAEQTKPLEVMPRLVIYQEGDSYLTLVTAKAFHGKTIIEGQHYDIWLGHNRIISGWFDQPSTAFHLIRDGDFNYEYELRANWLSEFRRINGVDYQLSATPSGDQLTISRYRGPYGTFKISSGNRPGRARMYGFLYSGQATYEVGGRLEKSGRRKAVSSCRVPVGDYTAGLDIYLGDLHLSTGHNRYVDGRRDARANDSPVLSVKIRQGKPFVLDFSAQPEVLFTSPGKDERITCGQELFVEAVLVDPELDLMFTDLERRNRSLEALHSDEFEFTLFGTGIGITVALGFGLISCLWRSMRRTFLVLGALVAIIAIMPPVVFYAMHIEHRYKDISPNVTITRSDGEIVATGIMPFG